VNDDDNGSGMAGFMGGSATTLNTDGKAPKRTREFPPGFHGANPGPSHDDERPRPRVSVSASSGRPSARSPRPRAR
jgi:hypothetical protein